MDALSIQYRLHNMPFRQIESFRRQPEGERDGCSGAPQRLPPGPQVCPNPGLMRDTQPTPPAIHCSLPIRVALRDTVRFLEVEANSRTPPASLCRIVLVHAPVSFQNAAVPVVLQESHQSYGVVHLGLWVVVASIAPRVHCGRAGICPKGRATTCLHKPPPSAESLEHFAPTLQG